MREYTDYSCIDMKISVFHMIIIQRASVEYRDCFSNSLLVIIMMIGGFSANPVSIEVP